MLRKACSGQKVGQGQKIELFCAFFCVNHCCKGMQLKINFFLRSFLCSKTSPCARNELFPQIINTGMVPAKRHVD